MHKPLLLIMWNRLGLVWQCLSADKNPKSLLDILSLANETQGCWRPRLILRSKHWLSLILSSSHWVAINHLRLDRPAGQYWPLYRYRAFVGVAVIYLFKGGCHTSMFQVCWPTTSPYIDCLVRARLRQLSKSCLCCELEAEQDSCVYQLQLPWDAEAWGQVDRRTSK